MILNFDCVSIESIPIETFEKRQQKETKSSWDAFTKSHSIMTVQFQCQNEMKSIAVNAIYSTFSHHWQGNIDFNTVNTNHPTGMYFLIHP